MKEHGICAKCKKSVGCPYADDRITGCKNFVLEPELRLTNEEWLRSCTTEELAKFLQSISVLSLESKDEDLEDWKRWLKEKHE